MGNFQKVVLAALLLPTLAFAQGGGGLPLVCTPTLEYQPGGVLCVAEDGISTGQLDDGASTPVLGYWLIVDPSDTTKMSYWDPAEAIGTAELANGGVTNVKLGDDAVSQAKLLSDGTPVASYWVVVDPLDNTKFAYVSRLGSEVTNVPAGDIVATTVQAAIDELDTEKAKDFLELDDTPADYTNQGGHLVVVNDTEDGLEYIPAGGTIFGGYRWSTTTTATCADIGKDACANTSTMASVTNLRLSNITLAGSDASPILSEVAVDDKLVVQAKSDSTRFVKVTVTAVDDPPDGTNSHGWTVTVDDSGGTLTNNEEVIVFLRAGSSGGGGGATIMNGTGNLFGSAVFADFDPSDFTLAYEDACVGGTNPGTSCPLGTECTGGVCTADAKVAIALDTTICRQGAACGP